MCREDQDRTATGDSINQAFIVEVGNLRIGDDAHNSEEQCMFESLDEQMKRDDNLVSSTNERMIRYALYALVAVMVFGGLIFAVHLMS